LEIHNVKFYVLTLILVSVTISALAQIALKAGMSTPGIQRAVDDGGALELVAGISTSPLVLAGLALYFAGALVWLMVLARAEVSLDMPLVPLVAIFAAIALMELGKRLIRRGTPERTWASV
jgi:hypothetical protein